MTDHLAPVTDHLAPVTDHVAPWTARQRVAAVLVGLLGAFTALWRLGTAQVLPDELVYVRAGASLVAGTGDTNLEHPPLGKFLFGLAQEFLTTGPFAARLVTALAGLVIGWLLFVLLRRIADTTTALVGAALWVALPHAGGVSGPLGQTGRLDRFAMLDPIAAALAMGALLAGWSWLERPRWQAAALTGALGGLAAGAKPTGGLVLPAIAMVVLWTRRDELPRPAAGVAIAVLASIVGLGLAYLPLGSGGLDGLRHLVDFQATHAADGHVVTVAGRTTAFPPWWSHLWFHVRDDGWVLTSLLFGGAVAAPLLVRTAGPSVRRGVTLLWSVLGVLLLAFAASPVKLPFYRYAWWPLLVALLAIALVAGVRRAFHVRVAAVTVRLGALVPVAVAMVLASLHLVQIATIEPGGYQLVAPEFVGDSGFVDEGRQPLLLRGRGSIFEHYTDPHGHQLVVRTDDLAEANAVLLDPEITSRFPRPELDAIVDADDWSCRPFAELVLCLRSFP